MDEGPLPQLRTGVLPLEVRPAMSGKVVGYASRGARYYVVEFQRGDIDGNAVSARLHVDSPAAAVGVLAESEGTVQALIRVPEASGAATAIEGTLYRAVGFGQPGWIAVPFTATVSAKAPRTSDLPNRWAAAFGQERRGSGGPWWMARSSHPWNEFAAGRVWSTVTTKGARPRRGNADGSMDRQRRTDLSALMHTTTAASSMQEALQHDRGLRLRGPSGPATIALAELEGPPLAEHPWASMRAALPKPNGGTPEPLARVAPADFWYVRFDDLRVLLDVLDEAEAWMTPVARVMEARGDVHGLSKRYQAQLGLRRSGLAKTLGHTVVERVSVVGSDPYLREGSDVTFAFELRNQAVFHSELARHMRAYESEVLGIVTSKLTHGSHVITVHRDPAGVVRQHRAQVDDVALVSNSEGAIRAVLDAIDGKRPRLSEEPDFGYMLARDPGAHDGFAFLSDRFIATVVGPEQKILASRRQQALAELLTPGYSALLYGWLEGRAPSDTESLIASGLLDRDELRHRGGAKITFSPGTAARSSWGSPASLTPMIDLPRPTKVTKVEKDAYGAFVRGYQNYWRSFIDPVAIRFDLEETAGTKEAIVDVRVLPLISGTEYSQIAEVVGDERVDVPAIDDGLQMVWAVGAESALRRELDQTASALTGSADIGLGWLGDWVMVGSLDRRAVLDFIVATQDDIQLPRSPSEDERIDRDLELARKIGKLPVYAAAHVRNPTALIVGLTAIRAMVNQVAPGMIQWGEDSKYRDYPIVRIGIDPSAQADVREFADAIALYYVQAEGTIVFALSSKVLEAIIDRIVDGRGPKSGLKAGPQFVVDARFERGRASWTALAWALQGQANRSQASSRAAAEIVLRGDPSVTTSAQLIERSRAYFGSHPVSASGRTDFELLAHGVSDPVHGSEAAPAFPELPVAGSPIEALMQRMVRFQASVAFDEEPAQMNPPARSLHTRVRLRLGE
ncbi:MAG: hypothetical protein AAGA54_34035 [Myxococcota bacterium]